MYNRIKEWEGSGSQKSITFLRGGLSVQGERRACFFLPSIPLFESRSYDKRDSERGVSTTQRSRVEREYTGGDVFFFEFLRIMHARETMSVNGRGCILVFLRGVL